MRTLWVCNVSGGPFEYVGTEPGSTPLGLEEAHREFRISSAEFDEVASVLAQTMDAFEIPATEKEEVLGAFAAHKGEVTEGSMADGLAPEGWSSNYGVPSGRRSHAGPR